MCAARARRGLGEGAGGRSPHASRRRRATNVDLVATTVRRDETGDKKEWKQTQSPLGRVLAIATSTARGRCVLRHHPEDDSYLCMHHPGTTPTPTPNPGWAALAACLPCVRPSARCRPMRIAVLPDGTTLHAPPLHGGVRPHRDSRSRPQRAAAHRDYSSGSIESPPSLPPSPLDQSDQAVWCLCLRRLMVGRRRIVGGVSVSD